ncbi:PEF-CTERM sorting domain-containing protein [Methanolobus profundi]|uniref:PEF-CTERM protein sorting domain-containing protein n=1 Tax=Methanolobus profundi TaxID=487685 RepID=A0A1I4RXX7_9EURY|nr:PEF-CTERM sorting domain-containing protein [Methanolobus profundi]SFM57078.1 PEF-CTERM protein sorting domain-containing protein [Methanolobus profundi]
MKKLLTILLIALVALVGTASANYGADLADSSGVVLPNTVTQMVGTPVDYSIILTDFTGETVYYKVGFNDTGLTMDILKQGTYVSSNPFTDYDIVRVTVEQGAAQGDSFSGRIDVYREDPDANVQAVAIASIPFWASASQNFNAQIPEFPTIALPVAAIIGLAFFMQRRKEE